MKTIKVSIIDENTLSLLEDGNKGDTVSLKNLHEQDIDKSNISDVIKSKIKNEVETELGKFKAQINLEKEKDLEVIVLQKEKALKEELETRNNEEYKKHNDEITSLKLQLEKLNLENTSLKKQTQKDIELATITLETKYKENIMKQEYIIKKLEEEKQTLEENTKNKLLIEFNEKESEHKYELQLKDREISELKDLQLRRSTKMVGETLEKHCELEFNRIREFLPSTVYFEKDNDASTGSKGDFIYKEYDDNSELILSIMFEMKNEMDTTATKHKNQDFFKELDKDRKEKDCEFAVLVSLLEKEDDLYNDGIYIVPETQYKDMYVIRPQYFIPIIMLLRKVCKKTTELKNEIIKIKERNLDITNFENNLLDFKDKFGRNYRLASDKFQDAIKRIDSTIDNLQKIKADLMGSDDNLRLASNKLEDLTIKKLAKNSPTILALTGDADDKSKRKSKKEN